MNYIEQRKRASRLQQLPRWEYDCGHCKMVDCGPQCACFPHLYSGKSGPRRWYFVKVGTHSGEIIEVRPAKVKVGDKIEFRRGNEPWQTAVVDGELKYGGIMISLL